MAANKAAPAKADGDEDPWGQAGGGKAASVKSVEVKSGDVKSGGAKLEMVMADWERAARDYANPDVALADIAARLKIHPMALVSQMRTKGVKRGKANSNAAEKLKARNTANKKSKKAPTHKPIELVQRVYNTIETQIGAVFWRKIAFAAGPRANADM